MGARTTANFTRGLTAIAKAYQDGRKLAIKEGKLAKFGVRMPEESEYPLNCPFSVEQILDEDFLGD
ncbi:MAG: DUF29 family protein [Synechocystis sp.]